MVLANMIHTDRFALECDLAETYHIYDIYGLPLHKVALFSCGLREDSRIMMKLTKSKANLNQMLLASISDSLSIIIWKLSGGKKKKKPNLLTESFKEKEKSHEKLMTFSDGQEFEKYYSKLITKKGE